MNAPAVVARERADRSHHWTVQALSEMAAEFADLADLYDGHVGTAEAIAQQTLLEDAAVLRCVGALTIRGTYSDDDAHLWIIAAARRLEHVYAALRGER